jgi:hypothetical protein
LLFGWSVVGIFSNIEREGHETYLDGRKAVLLQSLYRPDAPFEGIHVPVTLLLRFVFVHARVGHRTVHDAVGRCIGAAAAAVVVVLVDRRSMVLVVVVFVLVIAAVVFGRKIQNATSRAVQFWAGY